jgi:hypothetical protein
MRSEGGKAPRATCPRRILKPSEPVREIPSAPQAHGMTITAHLGGDPEIRRMIGRGGPQDQATPEREGLGGGVRARKRLQLCPFLVRYRHWGSIRDWHESNPRLESGKTDIFFL